MKGAPATVVAVGLERSDEDPIFLTFEPTSPPDPGSRLVNSFSRICAIVAVLSPFALASCGGESAQEQAGGEVSAEFQEIDASAAEGLVTLTRADDTYTATVAMDTHRGPGDYPVAIHSGTCAAGGPVVVELTAVQGQEGGEGRATTTFPASQLPAGASYFVQLNDAAGGGPLACADLPALEQ